MLYLCSNCFPNLVVQASLRVPGADSDDETKTPSPSPHHGRSRPPSLIADSSSESDEGDARGEVGTVEPEQSCLLDNRVYITFTSEWGSHLQIQFVCFYKEFLDEYKCQQLK